MHPDPPILLPLRPALPAGVAYSAAQPAILPYCLMYFCLFWIVRRYQTIYVFERCYESGGLFWPLAFQAILYMLLLFQVFMSAVLIFFGASVQVRGPPRRTPYP